MGVPFYDLTRQLKPLREEVLAALGRVWDSGAFALGPEVEQFEAEFAQYFGFPYAVGCASGSDALLLALMSLGVGPGDEVIVPSFTFFATASAVWRLGARPVFADIELESFNVCPDDVGSRVTARTRAIIPVHLFGQCARMDRIMEIARSNGLAVVEDVAQAIGARWNGQVAGSFGEVGCFSFYPTKNLGGAGDGGMMVTGSAVLAERLRLLRCHGMSPRYYHQVVGINSRLDGFQAAVLRIKLRYLAEWEKRRAEKAAVYFALFEENRLADILVLPRPLPGAYHVWNQFVVRVPEGRRDCLREFLKNRGIGTEIYYPLGLHEQKCFASLGYRPEDLPNTFRASREVLALPIFPELTEEEQAFVVGAIAEYYHGQAVLPAHPQRLKAVA
ncbi:MAG: DegT/DnrJ/EryC1/StrS family aminotransferase [Thermoguttaceae bacterium]|nr:DegT/DnrJ/EryC1/StrS family aminotransferase [Thermoguttaceae bacterium]MDW8078574.1 DegT/DnrJ/EryC1/StrS family aminotransferase [Thermoguttaceae bacterium]